MKLDSEGNVEWIEEFDKEFVESLVETNDKGLVLVGYTELTMKKLIKTNSEGKIKWIKNSNIITNPYLNTKW